MMEDLLATESIIVLVDTKYGKQFIEMICSSPAIAHMSKRLVFISSEEFPVRNGMHDYVTVSEEEMGELLDLYGTYEFSDKIVLLSDNMNYGSIWNYVRSGMLTSEEAFKVLLT